MTHQPAIQSILAFPGFSGHTVSVGLVLADIPTSRTKTVWGTCQPALDESLADYPAGFEPAAAVTTIRELIIPALLNRPLFSFRELAAEVDAIQETAAVVKPLPTPAEGKLSRRDLFAGRLRGSEETPSLTHQVTIRRQLHPAIRNGTSQALLAAVAVARGQTAAEVITAEYDLPPSSGPAPIYGEIDGQETLDAALVNRLAALGTSVAGTDPPGELGPNGEKPQRFIRQLGALVAAVADDGYRPTLSLDFRGGLGQLFQNNLGKILGALYGLESAAAPYPLRVVDPLIGDSLADQAQGLARLKEYLTLRGMTLQLAAGKWVRSAGDVVALAEANAVDAVRIDLLRLGSLHQSIEAVLAARGRGLTAILSGPPETAVPVALAARPHLVMAAGGVNLAALHDEMTRAAASLSPPGPP
jgi:methylaspartate ammonia-lyase